MKLTLISKHKRFNILSECLIMSLNLTGEKLRQQSNYRMIPWCFVALVRMVSGGTGSDTVLPLQARVHAFLSLRAGHWPGWTLLIFL